MSREVVVFEGTVKLGKGSDRVEGVGYLNGLRVWLQVQVFPIVLHNISISFPVLNVIVSLL
jgi:hypothetical protein